MELSGLPVFDRERAFSRLSRLRRLPRHRAAQCDRARAPAGARPARFDAPAAPIASSDVRPQDAPGLTPVERYAFDELSRRLTSRINEADARAQPAANTNEPAANANEPAGAQAVPIAETPPDAEPAVTDQTRPFLDRLPIGVLVYRLSHLLYANQAFLDWAGSESLDALAEAGGLDSLMIESGDIAIEEGGRKSFADREPERREARRRGAAAAGAVGRRVGVRAADHAAERGRRREGGARRARARRRASSPRSSTPPPTA